MKNPFHSPFAAVFRNEVLLNAKRVTPYVLMVLFAANCLLWWGWGPAVQRGWATNSEFYISRNFAGFSIVLGLPIFTAIIMGDAVIRDFRLGVDPLVFSKPVGRASYLLGKFFGNFFVLVCCQSAFAITFFLLQWVPFSGMVILPVRVVPYFKHFFFLVVITHLGWAAIYFLAGTLSRNSKVVYGLAACFYPVYTVFSISVSKLLPASLGGFFAPWGLNVSPVGSNPWDQKPDLLNNLVVSYSLTAYANRASIVFVTALLLWIVYLRFTFEPREERADHFSWLTLSEATNSVPYSVPSYGLLDLSIAEEPARERVPLPKVTSARGPAATLYKILGALAVELRLLRAERGFIVLIPLAIFLCFLSVPFSQYAPEISYSVTSATNTANMLLLFFVCVLIFYTGEIMHRDRELKIEPVVWSTPAPTSVLLLSKFLAMTLLAVSLVIVGSLATIVVQFLRGHTPVEFSAYLIINGVVVVPGVLFMTSAIVALNVLLRNKYVTYVIAVGMAAGLLYLYNTGYNHWLYNPLLYQLWKYADLTTQTMLVNRLYCLALAAACLLLAHLFFARKSS